MPIAGDGRQQSTLWVRPPLPEIGHEEGAGAIGVLGHARLPAALSVERGLLVACHAGDRDPGHRLDRGFPEEPGARSDLGEHGRRDVERLQQDGIPLARVNVVQQRAGRVGRVGDVGRAAGELPDQPGVDGAEEQGTVTGPGNGFGIALEDPANLAAGKVRVDDQAGPRAQQGGVSGAVERVALRGGLSALPHDGGMHRHAGGTVPDDRGFPLIRDAECFHLARPETGTGDRLAHHPLAGLPDLAWVLLHPSGLRVGLTDLAIGPAEHRAIVCEDQRRTAGCSLVERQDCVRHRLCSFIAGQFYGTGV